MADPGWYPNPEDSGATIRYFDGQAWTAHVQAHPTAAPTAPPTNAWAPTTPPPVAGGWSQPAPQVVYVQPRRSGFAKGCLVALGLAALAVVGLIVLIAVAAHNTSTPGKGTSAHPAAADVTVTCGTTDSLGVMHAAVTITNHSSESSDYVVDVSFNNASGNRLSSGTAIETHLVSGQTATDDVVGLGGATGSTPTACVATNVTRTAAP